ncbi:MAG: hypothetical protein ACRC1F_00020 [Metamycoplasmataceae bacterium]
MDRLIKYDNLIKKKALELYELMLDNQVNTDDGYLEKNNAKKCAIVAVSEILKNNFILLDGQEYYRELNFWEAIKTEIENLPTI